MKNKSLQSRVIVFILCTLIIFSSATPASAYTSPIEMTLQESSELVALSFMRNSLDESVEISSTTPFFDLDGNVTAYCVSFEIQEKPSGYVLISLINPDNPIVEFSFEGPGLVATITQQEQTSSLKKGSQNQIIYLGTGTFYLQKGDNVLYDVISNKGYSTSQISATYDAVLNQNGIVQYGTNVDIGDGILDWEDASIDSSSIEKISGFGSGTDYWLMDDFSSGNVCSPTCATNVMWYWGVQRGRSWAVETEDYYGEELSGFDLADAIFTSMSSYMSTIPPLGTLELFLHDAYVNFLGLRGTNYELYTLNENDYSSFTDAIDDGYPIHTMLRNEFIFDTGHDVMTIGYGESTKGTDYLFVMDGWYPYGRFVDFDYYPIVKGLAVWVGSRAIK